LPITFAGTNGTSGATLTVPSAGQWLWCGGATAGGTTATISVTAATTVQQIVEITVTSGNTAGGSWVPDCAPYNLQAWTQEDTDRVLAGHRQEIAEARRRRARAEARARELLLSLLTDEQAVTYTRDGWFEVTGSAGGVFRIRRDGQAGNVDELPGPGAERIASWCCHPPGELPDADAHAAQYLQLVCDEPGFRATGNRTPRRARVRAA
jgi:hypothetical protein